MSDKVKIIKCPRLNNGKLGYGMGSREMALKIGPPENDPVAIMCDRYDPEKGCRIDFYADNTNKTEYKPCIFAEWTELRKR